MSLQQTINNNLKEAMKNRDADTLSTLRMLNASLLNYSIAQNKRGQDIDDEKVISIISSEIKKRKDSIESYEKGGRDELAQKEKKELTLLQTFMPEQASEDEIKKIVQDIIDGGLTDFGKIMGMAMGKLKGKADGSVIKKIIEETLS